MAWIWATLMPHPPVIIPEVGRGREKEAATTLAGLERLFPLMEEASSGLKLDCIMLLSPHQTHAPSALFMNATARMSGSFDPFGAPEASLSLEGAPGLQAVLAEYLFQSGIPVLSGMREDLTRDQGSLVPLLLLSRRFGVLPPVITASPIGLTPAKALELGHALAAFDDGRNWALLASGDLSHRLTPDAPAGFSRTGKSFDLAVVRALRAGDPGILEAVSDSVIADAGECGLRSVMALLGLAGGPLDVLAYEGPFGVGYCTAFRSMRKDAAGLRPRPEAPPSAEKKDAPVSSSTSAQHVTAGSVITFSLRPQPAAVRSQDVLQGTLLGHPYPRLARLAVSRHLSSTPCPVTIEDAPVQDADTPLWTERKACFVSIKTRSGTLRGCIGTTAPVRENLRAEIMGNAVSAATQDPRFPPMKQAELPQVMFSVDVLNPPEPVSDLADLDPAVWGVIVSKGGRRGLLLPALEGVNSVEQQIAIAARKGGILDLKGIFVQRFSVSRYKEE